MTDPAERSRRTDLESSSPAEGAAGEAGVSRRTFLQGVLTAGAATAFAGGALTLAGCTQSVAGKNAEAPSSSGGFPTPFRTATGPTREHQLTAEVGNVEVAPARPYRTWLYNGAFPGPEIRLREGERLRVTLKNKLPEGTTVHWHGVPVPNPMDGVPNVTQKPVAPGQTFVYEFVAGPAGSYLYHTHVGLQLDRGLFGPLIIEEARPSPSYDREYVVVLDDYLPTAPRMIDGWGAGMMGGYRGMMGRHGGMTGGGTGPGYGMMGPGYGTMAPGTGMMGPGNGPGGPGGHTMGPGTGMRGPGGSMMGTGNGMGGPGGSMYGMGSSTGGPGGRMTGRGGGMTGPGGGMMGGMMGGIATPPYAGLLINGKLPEAAPSFLVSRGDRVRFRFVNPSGATTYRVALAGHRFTITHTDGRPVKPVTVDAFDISMGERYDAVVEAKNPGAWTLMAAPLVVEAPPAQAVVRYKGAARSKPAAGEVPEGLQNGRLLSLDDLISIEAPNSPAGAPDRSFDLVLSGGMMSSAWMINGQAYPDADPLEIHKGERVRVRMINHSMMLHPMHLHGHFFRVGQALKDVVVVPPYMGRVTFDFEANNPGNWFFHCHNIYHMVSGMARVIRYA